MMRVAVGGYLIATNTFATQEMSTDLLQKATLRDARVLGAGGRTGAIQGFVGESERQFEHERVVHPEFKVFQRLRLGAHDRFIST